MIKLSKVLIATILAIFATGATADETVCKGCDPQKQESSHREQIKADRAKYDRENLDTGATADETGCKGCDPQKQESSHREQTKADRAKYDRENEKISARPWDAIRNDKPPQVENK
jgi:hypothetical protein